MHHCFLPIFFSEHKLKWDKSKAYAPNFDVSNAKFRRIFLMCHISWTHLWKFIDVNNTAQKIICFLFVCDINWFWIATTRTWQKLTNLPKEKWISDAMCHLRILGKHSKTSLSLATCQYFNFHGKTNFIGKSVNVWE